MGEDYFEVLPRKAGSAEVVDMEKFKMVKSYIVSLEGENQSWSQIRADLLNKIGPYLKGIGKDEKIPFFQEVSRKVAIPGKILRIKLEDLFELERSGAISKEERAEIEKRINEIYLERTKQ
ncbi:MAG: hypothetical protein ACOYS2_02455 [Patescibacteria group bacterium]